MELVAHGVDDKGESTEEGDEGDDAGVEELLGGEDIGELGVHDGETDGHGEVDPSLQKGNNLGARTGGGNDQDILGITEDGVVVENAVNGGGGGIWG